MSQLTRAQWDALYEAANGQFLDNTTRLITELKLRTFAGSLADSFLMLQDDYLYYLKTTTASGTDTYTIPDTIPAAYTSGERFLVTFTNANTGAATLNRNGLGAKDLKTLAGSALSAGQIVSGGVYLVQYNGTNYRIISTISTESSSDVDLYLIAREDFTTVPSNTLSLSNFNNGGGLGASPSPNSTFGVDNTEHATGVIDMSTSTSTAGGSAIHDTTYLFTFGFGFSYALSWRAAISVLSDGTDTYKVRIGFIDSISSSTPVDGAYFEYTHGANSGKWEAVTVSNSTETREDTGITAAITNYSVFKIVVNSDATQVDFYIDGTKTNDITTNIINDSARTTGKVATIEKTAGSTARHLYCDYVLFTQTRGVAR